MSAMVKVDEIATLESLAEAAVDALIAQFGVDAVRDIARAMGDRRIRWAMFNRFEMNG